MSNVDETYIGGSTDQLDQPQNSSSIMRVQALHWLIDYEKFGPPGNGSRYENHLLLTLTET